MAELVRDHALQLVALEPRGGAARHGDGGVGRRIARGEGVDAVLVLEHVHLGHGHARGDGHLLDDVVQALEREVAGAALDARAAERARDRAAAGAQRESLEEAGAADDGQHHDAAADHRVDRRGCRARRTPTTNADHRVDRDDHQRDGNQERDQEPARRATRGFLAGEKSI